MGEAATVLPATGNSGNRAVMLRVSGGAGNLGDGEVHLRLTDGVTDFAQGWFLADDLLAAVHKSVNGRVA